MKQEEVGDQREIVAIARADYVLLTASQMEVQLTDDLSVSFRVGDESAGDLEICFTQIQSNQVCRGLAGITDISFPIRYIDFREIGGGVEVSISHLSMMDSDPNLPADRLWATELFVMFKDGSIAVGDPEIWCLLTGNC